MPFRKPSEKDDHIWLMPTEYETYIDHLKDVSEESQLAFRLGSESSLRRYKQLEFQLDWRIDHPNPEIEIVFIEVPDRKYSGTKDFIKDGIAYVPKSLWDDLVDYAERQGIDKDEPVIQCSGGTLKNHCKEAGEVMADEANYQVYEHMRPHDGRRYFAHYMHHIAGLEKRIVKYLGGWESDSIFNDYALVCDELVIQSKLAECNITEIEVPKIERDSQLRQLHDSVRELRDLVKAENRIKDYDIDYQKLAKLDDDDLGEFKRWVNSTDEDVNHSLSDYKSDRMGTSGAAVALKLQELSHRTTLPITRYLQQKYKIAQDNSELVNPQSPYGKLKLTTATLLIGIVLFMLVQLDQYSLSTVITILIVSGLMTVFRLDISPNRSI